MRGRLLAGLLEIVETEGPVMTIRVFDVRLAAADLGPTRESLGLLARAMGALMRARHIVDCGDRVPTVHTLSQPEMMRRTLGPRSIEEVPPSELDAAIRSTGAWRRRESIGHIQRATLDMYGVNHISMTAATHLNACIQHCNQRRPS